MADSWEDNDAEVDDWETADIDELDNTTSSAAGGAWDDEEEDLSIKEKASVKASTTQILKTKGTALALKREAETLALHELSLAKRAMALEAAHEENMTVDERRLMERKRIEDADFEAASDLFGGVDDGKGMGNGVVKDAVKTSLTTVASTGGGGGDLVFKELKDYLKNAKKIGIALKADNKAAFSTSFFKDLILEVKDVLDTDAISEIIKTLNVVNNEKIALEKRVSKGAAAKPKKDKAAAAKAKNLAKELYGDNDQYDATDDYGAQYEDSFF